MACKIGERARSRLKEEGVYFLRAAINHGSLTEKRDGKRRLTRSKPSGVRGRVKIRIDERRECFSRRGKET